MHVSCLVRIVCAGGATVLVAACCHASSCVLTAYHDVRAPTVFYPPALHCDWLCLTCSSSSDRPLFLYIGLSLVAVDLHGITTSLLLSPAGIKAAVAAGLPVIGLTTTQPAEALKAAGAVVVVKDFRDVMAIIEAQGCL